MKLFIITIDTEADCSADWTGAIPESYQNLLSLRERLLPVAEKYGAVATLLLNGDILHRTLPSQHCEWMHRNYGWELGTHLHGEFVGPQQKLAGPAGIRLQDFQCGYEPKLEFEKMARITELFFNRFGVRPTSFRAGRFGAGPTTFEACLKLGYEVDTSVVPGAFLQEGKAIADFRAFDHNPWIIARNSENALLEIPITLKPGWIPPPSNYLPRGVFARAKGSKSWYKMLARIGYGFDLLTKPLHQTTWLRPSYSSEREMIQLIKWLSCRETRYPVVANMMFHSNELLPGASPYNASEADVMAFLGRLSATLAAARDANFTFVTTTEAARRLKEKLK